MTLKVSFVHTDLHTKTKPSPHQSGQPLCVTFLVLQACAPPRVRCISCILKGPRDTLGGSTQAFLGDKPEGHWFALKPVWIRT